MTRIGSVVRRVAGHAWARPAAVAAAVLLLAGSPAWAMHISDGVLPPRQAAIWFLLSAPFVALGVRDLKRRKAESLSFMPLAAMVGATVFILSVLHVPIALPGAGSSSHPTGGALAAIIVGPWVAVLLNCIALLLQALFLGHGGIWSWGANTFSMGISGVLLGYGVFLVLGKTRLPLFWRAGLAAFVSDLLGTYGMAAFQLAVALHGDKLGISQAWGLFMAGYLPTQLPLALMDLVVAGYMCSFIAERRPDIAAQIGMLPKVHRLGVEPAA